MRTKVSFLYEFWNGDFRVNRAAKLLVPLPLKGRYGSLHRHWFEFRRGSLKRRSPGLPKVHVPLVARNTPHATPDTWQRLETSDSACLSRSIPVCRCPEPRKALRGDQPIGRGS